MQSGSVGSSPLDSSPQRSDEQAFRAFARVADVPSTSGFAPVGQPAGSAREVPDLPVIEGVEEFFASLENEPAAQQPASSEGTSGARAPAAAVAGPSRQEPARVTPEILQLAQRWVGRAPGQMTMAQFADGAGVNAAALKVYLRSDGSLTVRGLQLLSGGVQGGQLRGVTAEIVRQAQAAVAAGQSLGAFAHTNNVSANSLRNFVHTDGSLTVRGSQLLAGGARGGHLGSVTAEVIRRAQAAVAAGETLSAFADRHNVSLNSLQTVLHADGSLTAMGRAQLSGRRTQPVNAEVLRQAQAAMAAGQSLEVFARTHDVSLASLRHCVRTDGTLTMQGAQLLAGGVQGGQLRGVTAETVRQAQAAIAAGQSLGAFADANRVSLGRLRASVHVDGSLTVRGAQLVAGGVQGGQLRGVTAEIVRQAQAAIAAGQSLSAFADANNVSFTGLKSAIRADGSLTARGRQLLGHAQERS